MAKSSKAQLKDFVSSINEILSAPIPRTELQKIGNSVVAEMKDFISKGTSPIKSNGRFKPYKNSYLKAIKKGSLAYKKNVRPVNLKLSGEFLNDLKATVIGKTIEIGYRSQLSVNKELGHREGTNNQERRPTIPVQGEEFNATITDLIQTQFEKAFEKAIKKL